MNVPSYQVLSDPHGVTGQPLVGVLVGGGLDKESVLPLRLSHALNSFLKIVR